MIAFSYDIFQMQKYGGVSRCIYEIARYAAGVREVTIYAGSTANGYLFGHTGIEAKMVGRRTEAVSGRFRGALLWELPFARWISRNRCAVVHRSYYPLVDLLPRRIPVVETLHDMMWERAGDGGGETSRLNSLVKRRALERADAIACVSHNTLGDLAKVWPKLAEKAVVIPHGVSRLSEAPVPCDETKPFFLFVGSREQRKNFGVLLKALADNPVLRDIDLICVGGGDWSPTERTMLTGCGLAGRVRQMQLSDDALAGYFEAAVALLYPSRYEGFGMPLLEAMVHACAVISSDRTSLPEVGGPDALYCSPDSVDEWRQAMELVLTDADLRRDLQRRGLARARQFSWQSAGRRYVELYDQLAAGS